MRMGTVMLDRSVPPILPKTLYPLEGILLAFGSTNSICRGTDANLYMMHGSVGWELNPPTCAGFTVNHYVDVACSQPIGVFDMNDQASASSDELGFTALPRLRQTRGDEKVTPIQL